MGVYSVRYPTRIPDLCTHRSCVVHVIPLPIILIFCAVEVGVTGTFFSKVHEHACFSFARGCLCSYVRFLVCGHASECSYSHRIFAVNGNGYCTPSAVFSRFSCCLIVLTVCLAYALVLFLLKYAAKDTSKYKPNAYEPNAGGTSGFSASAAEITCCLALAVRTC